jgi:hypothetical protein
MAARTSLRITWAGRPAPAWMSLSCCASPPRVLRGDLAVHRREQHARLAVSIARPMSQHVTPAPSGQQRRRAAVIIGYPARRGQHPPVGRSSCAQKIAEIASRNLHTGIVAPRGSASPSPPPRWPFAWPTHGWRRWLERGGSFGHSPTALPAVRRPDVLSGRRQLAAAGQRQIAGIQNDSANRPGVVHDLPTTVPSPSPPRQRTSPLQRDYEPPLVRKSTGLRPQTCRPQLRASEHRLADKVRSHS